MLALWRTLQNAALLQCPVCGGALDVSDDRFQCVSCGAVFPVEGGVPLLLRPADVASIPDEVISVFNIAPSQKDRVQAALTTLTKYRAPSYPEFANFFARFEAQDTQAQPVPLGRDETREAIGKVECLSSYLTHAMRPGDKEFRSLRLRNGSDRILFTSDRNPLFLSYRIFTPNGKPVSFEGDRSPLPCPLRPGSELTVPVGVRLPAGLTGQVILRFYFLLEGVQWFDESPLVEAVIDLTTERDEFPALRRGDLSSFDLQEDVTRAEDFLTEAISQLRSKGVTRPRILEIGSGVHPIALRTCGDNATVVVSDISLIMQQLASIMHIGHPAVEEGRAAFASFDPMHAPFGAESFDIICMCAAMHHIPSPDGLLKRVRTMLSANGRFIAVREPCVVNPFEPTYIKELSNGFNEQMFELAEWREILTRGGLALDRAVIDFGCSLKFSARASSVADDIDHPKLSPTTGISLSHGPDERAPMRAAAGVHARWRQRLQRPIPRIARLLKGSR